jgi:hypothetical protein
MLYGSHQYNVASKHFPSRIQHKLRTTLCISPAKSQFSLFLIASILMAHIADLGPSRAYSQPGNLLPRYHWCLDSPSSGGAPQLACHLLAPSRCPTLFLRHRFHSAPVFPHVPSEPLDFLARNHAAFRPGRIGLYRAQEPKIAMRTPNPPFGSPHPDHCYPIRLSPRLSRAGLRASCLASSVLNRLPSAHRSVRRAGSLSLVPSPYCPTSASTRL